MADKKISALDPSTIPLAGTEVLPIVQGGSTVKVSVANLTAGRAVAMAGGSFTDNIAQGTASKGFDFTANTPAAGMTSQLLNWYEEGTWTPVLNGFTVIGSTTVAGTYVRMGNIVFARCTISAATSIASTGGTSNITGLPFAIGLHSSCEAVNLTLATGYISGSAYAGVGLFPPTWGAAAAVHAITSTYTIS